MQEGVGWVVEGGGLYSSLDLALKLANRYAQRLTGASLLVFANKTDVPGCMSEGEISEVRPQFLRFGSSNPADMVDSGYRWLSIRLHSFTSSPSVPSPSVSSLVPPPSTESIPSLTLTHLSFHDL